MTDVGHSPEGYDGDVAGRSPIQAGRARRIPDVAEQFFASLRTGHPLRTRLWGEEPLSLMMLIIGAEPLAAACPAGEALKAQLARLRSPAVNAEFEFTALYCGTSMSHDTPRFHQSAQIACGPYVISITEQPKARRRFCRGFMSRDVSPRFSCRSNPRKFAVLVRVDGFDQDEPASEGDEGCLVPCRVLAPWRDSFESFHFSVHL
ncbi:MAG: hypothetical protein ACREDT_13120, partial [Methylocella sp.]